MVKFAEKINVRKFSRERPYMFRARGEIDEMYPRNTSDAAKEKLLIMSRNT